MMDGTLLHKGTVQRADFRLIHPAPRQSYHIATKRIINHEATKVTSQGTQELSSYRKNSGISQTTRTSAEKRMTTQKTRFFPL